MGCTIWIFVILIAVIAYFLFRDTDSHSHKDSYSFGGMYQSGSHRPYAGDFMPYVGEVATGEGGYEDLDQPASRLDAQLCEECVSHCVALKVKSGHGTTFRNDRQHCFKFCKLECNPASGF